MSLDSLDVRFPAGRRVRDMRDGTEGTIEWSGAGFIEVAFDGGAPRQAFTVTWFQDNPTAIRLIPNIAASARE